MQSESEVAQLCPTLCNPVDCSPPCSSVHGIFQARVLEWVAISFSGGSSLPRDWTQVSHIVSKTLYRLSHQGSPNVRKASIKELSLTYQKNGPQCAWSSFTAVETLGIFHSLSSLHSWSGWFAKTCQEVAMKCRSVHATDCTCLNKSRFSGSQNFMIVPLIGKL